MSDGGDGPARGSRESELADWLDRLLDCGAAERRALIDGIAARDHALARELEELLLVLPDPERIEDAQPADDDRVLGEPAVGETIGGCTLGAVLGRGGVGTVYEARQLDPPRAVAVKVLRADRLRPRDLDRFRREVRALARLEHPAITRIYASGIENGTGVARPYIVMERIEEARSVVAWAREKGNGPQALAQLVATVCDAMQHGHNRGLIHRDLKPSNVLVDGDGRPRVIDFGVVRLTEGDDLDAPETLTGAILGTPTYMAPEQFEVAPSDLDARVDIHAIGVILYEALTGRRPYMIERSMAFDAARIMRGTDPAAPHLVDSSVPVDLSAIVLKAMAKDRERRYPSMSALAADLRAFAEGGAVGARVESRLERALRVMRRNRLATAGVSVALVSLAAATLFSMLALGAANRRSAAAEMALAMIAAGEGNVREATTALERMESAPNPILRGMVERLLDDSVAAPISPAAGHLVGGAVSRDGTRWAACGDGGVVVVADIAGATSLREAARIKLGDAIVWALAFSADGTTLYAGDWSGQVHAIDMHSQPLAARPIARVEGLVRGIAVSHDGARLLVLSSAGILSTVRLADGAVWQAPAVAQHGMARSLDWNGEGRAFIASGNLTLAAFDVPDDAAPVRVDLAWLPRAVPRATTVARSPEGELLAIGSASGLVRLVDSQTGSTVAEADCLHDVWSLSFSPDGKRLLVAARGGRVHEISVLTGSEIARHGTVSPDPAWAAAYAHDGSIVANIGYSITRLAGPSGWSTRLPAFPRGFPRALAPIAVNGPSPVLRAAAEDGSVWDLDISSGVWREIALETPIAAGVAAFDGTGARIAVFADDRIEIASLAGGARVAVPLVAGGRRSVAWDPLGDQVAVVCEGEVGIIGAEGTMLARGPVAGAVAGQEIFYLDARKPIVFTRHANRAAVDPDGQGGIVARAGRIPSSTRIIRSGGRWVLPTIGGPVLVSRAGGLQSLHAAETDYEFTLLGHTDACFAAEIDPAGRILATGGGDARIRFWDLARGELLATSTACDRPIRHMAWLDGGRALLVVDAVGKVTLLDSVPRAARVAPQPDQASTR